MESNNNYYITFGADIGDGNAHKAVGPHLFELRKLIYRFCNKKYCEEIDEIAPILRDESNPAQAGAKKIEVKE